MGKTKVSARASKAKPVGKRRKPASPRYPKDHPQHPENLKAAERVARSKLRREETKPEKARRLKSETVKERGQGWHEESLAANLNDSRKLQIGRLYDHLSEAVAKNSLSNVVKLETLIAKIQGTLEPAPPETDKPDAQTDGGSIPEWAQNKTEFELLRYAQAGEWPTAEEMKAAEMKAPKGEVH